MGSVPWPGGMLAGRRAIGRKQKGQCEQTDERIVALSFSRSSKRLKFAAVHCDLSRRACVSGVAEFHIPLPPSSSSRFSRSLNVFPRRDDDAVVFVLLHLLRDAGRSRQVRDEERARMDANCSRPVSTRATTAVTSGAAFSAASTEP